MRPPAIVAATLVGVLLLVGIAVGGWQGGWWLQQSATNHQNHIQRSSYEYQTTLESTTESIISELGAINVQLSAPGASADTVESLRAQRAAYVAQACELYHQMSGDTATPDVVAFASTNC